MRYAINENNEKIEPQYSGQRAICPGCKKEVTGKIYKNKMNHWAHLKSDCDKWYEPTSEWHLKWQNLFPKENQEVFMVDEELGERHRADIRLNNGVVIEIQNSPIVIKEVAQREKFYGQKGLIWILNAEKLIPDSTYRKVFRPDRCKILISFSTNCFDEMETENIINRIPKSIYINSKNISEDFICYDFESSSITYLELERKQLEMRIHSLIFKYSRRNYDYSSSFKVTIEVINGKYLDYEFLSINRWRKFIDEMQAPVFLDNVKDIGTDYLWWVQVKKKVEKERFIKKYLSYT